MLRKRSGDSIIAAVVVNCENFPSAEDVFRLAIRRGDDVDHVRSKQLVLWQL